MTNAEEPTEGAAEALAREAAHRFARTRGPDAEAHRAELEAWLAEAPEHRAAYNRAAEIFAMGKLLSEPDAPVAVAAPEPKRGRKGIAVALTVIAACAIGVGGWITYPSSAPTPDRPTTVAVTTDNRTLSTSSAPQTVQLADGSTVTLAADTVVRVEIAAGVRQLRLLSGKARFEVAHERRPFVVLAGGGSVTRPRHDLRGCTGARRQGRGPAAPRRSGCGAAARCRQEDAGDPQADAGPGGELPR